MTLVALALAAALTVTVLSFVGLLRSQQRAHARREDLLLNQMLNLAGKPWQPAPANEITEDWRERIEAVREARLECTTSPEQAL